MNKSFVDANALEKQIKDQREQQKQEAAKAAQQEASADKAQAAEAPAATPETVFSFRKMKEVPVDELLADYTDLGEQVRDKSFLLKGYATIERKIWGQTLRLRTLRKSEYRLVSALSEEQGRGGLTAKTFLFDEQTRWFVILMVQQWGGASLPDLKIPRVHGSALMADQTREQLKDFVGSKTVIERIELFDDMPREAYDDIAAICVDTLTAMTKLVERDLRNP